MPSEPMGPDSRFETLPHSEFLFKPPFTTLVLGTIGAGKTSFMYSLLVKYYPRYFDLVMVFTGTKDSNEVWDDEIIPAKDGDVKVYNTFNNSDFSKWVAELETFQIAQRDAGKPLKRVCVMFDDMMGQQIMNNHNRTALDNFMLHCRHYNASVILATQYLKLVSRSSREQGMFAAAFRMNAEQLEDFIDAFRRHASKQAVRALYHQVRDDKSNPYQFLLVDGKTGDKDAVFRVGFTKYVPLPNEH